MIKPEEERGHRMCFNLEQREGGVLLKQYECSEDDRKDSTMGAKKWSQDEGKDGKMSEKER